MKKIVGLLLTMFLCFSTPCLMAAESDDSPLVKRRREHSISPVSSASSTASHDLELTSYVLKERGDHFKEHVKDICANPKVVCIDFSSVNLSDEDLDTIFKGLVQREKKLEKTQTRSSLLLINIESDNITEEGVLRFLVKLQKGKREYDKTIYPDVRGTILKVGFSITEEFMDSVQESAPSVLAGRLRIVD